MSEETNTTNQSVNTGADLAVAGVPVKRGRGRPKGSKNRPKMVPPLDKNEPLLEGTENKPMSFHIAEAPVKRGRGRPKGSKNRPKMVPPLDKNEPLVESDLEREDETMSFHISDDPDHQCMVEELLDETDKQE